MIGVVLRAEDLTGYLIVAFLATICIYLAYRYIMRYEIITVALIKHYNLHQWKATANCVSERKAVRQRQGIQGEAQMIGAQNGPLHKRCRKARAFLRRLLGSLDVQPALVNVCIIEDRQ